MMKNLVKKKVQKEVKHNGKKALIYGGAVLTGAGAYFSYKAIKNHKLNKELEEDSYFQDSEYEIYNYDNNENSELEEKVNEFNSRRMNYDNCTHVSKEDLESYVNESQEDKKEDMDIDQNAYKEEPYEKYEYYEDDLSKEK
ncbi:hypothetical protein QOZ84_07610 [Romboutsia sedimentorum]|uniref:YtxH domain-containing protein n=1 Tax=Romboutsia sedimentorum TaxID=1368474 RepID=A0ABT7E920_9FIRM|nr:hypothetical protein [Romboutsia sedimentorum]MDK2563413.1 hypothetical protein [Romboutsia sedimentorum]